MSDPESDMRQTRENAASGWMELAQRDDLEYVIDAMLESPPNHTGTLERLSERTGIEAEELHVHLDLLQNLDVLEFDDEEYTVCDDSIVLQELFHLNSALNKKFGELNQSSSE